MSERNPVQELTDALTALRVDLTKVAQQIDTKAATPAQLAELAKAIKAANPAELATSVEVAGERAAQSLATTFDRKIGDTAKDLKTASSTLSENTATLAAAIIEAKNAGRWLNVRAALVLLLAVLLVFGGSAASLWWQQWQTASLKAQAADLSAQIQSEQANLAALAAKGGRIRWNTCDGRLCIQAAQDQATSGGSNPFANWSGWSTSDATKAPLIIPNGY